MPSPRLRTCMREFMAADFMAGTLRAAEREVNRRKVRCALGHRFLVALDPGLFL